MRDARSSERVAARAGLFILPHGLTIDRDDNVWLTDVAVAGDGRLGEREAGRLRVSARSDLTSPVL
jgi:streptogramin lyase